MTIEIIWFASSLFTCVVLAYSCFTRETIEIEDTESIIWNLLGIAAISVLFGFFLAPIIVLVGTVSLLAKSIDFLVKD